MAILIAILIAVPVTVSALHQNTQPKENSTIVQQNQSEPAKPETTAPSSDDAVTGDIEEQAKTDVQATVTNTGGQSQTELNVNNQSIPIPANGTVHEVVRSSDGGTTSVNVSSNSTSEGSGTTKSKTKIKVKSSTSTDMDFSSSD